MPIGNNIIFSVNLLKRLTALPMASDYFLEEWVSVNTNSETSQHEQAQVFAMCVHIN
jgi:hypothetical protein